MISFLWYIIDKTGEILGEASVLSLLPAPVQKDKWSSNHIRLA